MKKVLMLLILPIALMLSSCANEFDVQLVKHHMDAEKSIAKSKSEAIQAKANAIAQTFDEDTTPLEAYLARDQIASMTVTGSGIEKVTTSNDVLLTVAADGKYIVKSIVTGTVLYRGVVGLTGALKDAGNTLIHNTGDGNQVTFKRNDTKQIIAGENNVANNENNSGSSGSSGSAEEGAVSDALWMECTTSPSKEVTLGEAASCFAQAGHDVEIKGGLAYLDGEEWDSLNEWEASKGGSSE